MLHGSLGAARNRGLPSQKSQALLDIKVMGAYSSLEGPMLAKLLAGNGCGIRRCETNQIALGSWQRERAYRVTGSDTFSPLYGLNVSAVANWFVKQDEP